MVPFIVLMANSHYGIRFLKTDFLPSEVPLLSFQVPVQFGPSVMFQFHLPQVLTPRWPPSQAKPLKTNLTCPEPLFYNLKCPRDFPGGPVVKICLPMQGTRVRSLVREDPTCRAATKPTCHNYWACTLEPTCHNYWAHVPQLLKPTRLEPLLCNKRSHRNEKPEHRNEE